MQNMLRLKKSAVLILAWILALSSCALPQINRTPNSTFELTSKSYSEVKGEEMLSLENYKYLENAEKIPFDYDTREFNLKNAWWLSELSGISYLPNNEAASYFAAAGFSEVDFFSEESTQVYILSNDHGTILVFRGTEGKQTQAVLDWIADLGVALASNEYGAGKVHHGFQRVLNKVWDKIAEYFAKKDRTNRPLWITGHSLGAALATLAADRLEKAGANVVALYTFGSPRVANIPFQLAFNVAHYRLVNHLDIVTTVPYTMAKNYERSGSATINQILAQMSYIHIGQVKYIDELGTIHDELLREENGIDAQDVANMRRLTQKDINKIKESLQNADARTRDKIFDHKIKRYSINLWNGLIKTLVGMDGKEMK
ncbi:MAG: hypothetical protein A2504_01385 [Bdellovibrionales bacterium RIFOXYD12_FULL_39_22]|nr:MAG: hypothetical protein A2385_02275 [Bdellovibrionales bacterium RIFOXYB1_FULL_39_21]OFZ42759.1 MAG: hypothetical protein A2485_10460 [Bdellovibrionales bacterium RIFOXYC12_FULL_39_17]OFZ47318.1 MAG: hypothetical protein A2404_15065 [Bdellovibrionales bacterium RIFOXYC1_FULL_39_130]OFZ70895.1 MAG: hypothetical protein A2451_15830 [Bdellovibrionales bacterium RIFOXYC2_FULL_39_8]OFZ75484.1 MAG: hypothetical protein A2560_04335 [Bdellovibrionales bacterium RIFOXYD1_FULL_39_84]OFZ93438.1 MAG: